MGMDWVTGIQRALDYVEAHLTEEIDYAEAARQACASSFHFQRIFTLLCGFSMGNTYACAGCPSRRRSCGEPGQR